MKTTERFNRAYDALVKAFFEGTLAKGECDACAVGNIINYSHPFTEDDRSELKYHSSGWVTVFCTMSVGGQYFHESKYRDKAKIQIDATGYSPKELAKIEWAFEKTCKIRSDAYYSCTEQEVLEDQYNGLAAVVDVLLALDNIKPEDHYKGKFKTHPKLITHDH
jgi:hypothetical protein